MSMSVCLLYLVINHYKKTLIWLFFLTYFHVFVFIAYSLKQLNFLWKFLYFIGYNHWYLLLFVYVIKVRASENSRDINSSLNMQMGPPRQLFISSNVFSLLLCRKVPNTSEPRLNSYMASYRFGFGKHDRIKETTLSDLLDVSELILNEGIEI